MASAQFLVGLVVLVVVCLFHLRSFKMNLDICGE